jgi:hypothetical protein
MKFMDGEYIPLIWDGPPDAHYIKGHVSHEEGIEILIQEGAIYKDTVIGQAYHCYGRWSMNGEDSREDGNSSLKEYKRPGRGRFKITVFNLGIFAKPAIINRK